MKSMTRGWSQPKAVTAARPMKSMNITALVMRKPAAAAVNWGAWAQADKTQSDGRKSDSEGSQKLDGRPSPPSPAGSAAQPVSNQRNSSTPVVAGQDEHGQSLPSDNIASYTVQQKQMFNKALNNNDELRKLWDAARGRDAQMMLVNSMIPSSVTYAGKITAASAEARIRRKITGGSHRQGRYSSFGQDADGLDRAIRARESENGAASLRRIEGPR